MITSLPDFKDDPMASTEGKLEAIQMAWIEEIQDDQD
jgi:FeS assembly protein IscX